MEATAGTPLASVKGYIGILNALKFQAKADGELW